MDDFAETDELVRHLIKPVLFCELHNTEHWDPRIGRMAPPKRVPATHWGSRGWNVDRPWPLCEECHDRWQASKPIREPDCMDQRILRAHWLQLRANNIELLRSYTTGINLSRESPHE